MVFINETGNTVKLNDIGKVIPFLGKQPQEIDVDSVKRSKVFQSLCLAKKFLIVSTTDERIEKNLLHFQNGKMAPEKPKIEVKIRGHFLTNSGYGKANRNLVYALSMAGVRVNVETSSDSNGSLNQMELQKIARYKRPFSNDTIVIDSMIPSFSPIKKDGKYRILNTTIEAESIPLQFVDSCQSYDEIWVPSDFCKKVLSDHGVSVPIYIIPNAVDSSLYNDAGKPHSFCPKLNKFVFVSVMSWSYRKGYDVLLKAYLKEFSNRDDVSLLIVSGYNESMTDAADKYISNATSFVGHPHVARVGREVPEFEMARLYKACNCFVLPSRGEGFGLPFVEAGMCGLPVIATRCSAQTMFLNDDNSYLLDVDKISPMEDGKTGIHYWDGQMFPELIDDSVIDKLCKLMRNVYSNYDEAQVKGKILQQSLAKYSLESVGKVAAERLENICKTLSLF